MLRKKNSEPAQLPEARSCWDLIARRRSRAKKTRNSF